MNGEKRQNDLDLFFSGRLHGPALENFISTVKSEPAMRAAIEQASASEAAFYALSWGLGSGAKQSAIETASEPFSRQEWQSIIDGAFDSAGTARPAARGRVLAFPRLARYLAAACLTVALAGAVMWLTLSRTADRSRIVAIGQVRKDTIRFASPEKKNDSVVTTIVFDSVTIYSMREAAKKPVCPANNDGILQLSGRTAVLLEKNSSLAVRQRLDSAVTFDMQYGSALFTVEKKRFHDFRIYTPESEIAVTGTVFRVRAEKDTTIVSVKEGSVRTRRICDTGFIAIPAGMSGYITSAGVVLACGDSAATLPYKRNLLRDFLEENGVWENGCFIRAGLSAPADSTSMH